MVLNNPEAIIMTYPSSCLKNEYEQQLFARMMMGYMNTVEDAVWHQKCKNKPKHDVLYLYFIVLGKIKYRLNVMGWNHGTPITLNFTDGQREVTWPRLELCGPVLQAPEDIQMRGFQGFRYTDKLFF